MPALASAAAGFLLAVLWFDLMFDTQALRHRDRELPEPALASISAYYRRVLVDASPMGHLVALAMLTTTAALIAGLAGDDVPTATAIASLAVALPAFAIAGLHTVPTAKRLAAQTDTTADQSALARSILRDHLVCLAPITALLALQLSAAL